MIKKIISITIIGCFLFSPAIAQEGKFIYHIISFEKLLNSHISPWLLPDNAASVAKNVRANERYGSVSKRPIMQVYHDGSAAWTSLHRYYKNSDSTDYWLMTTGTTLSIDDDEDGTLTTAMTGLTDGERWMWVTYMDKAIGMNGTDKAIKYDGKTTTTANTDGARTASNLCAELSTPFAELNTGSNLDASSWYQYRVAWYDDTTYTYSTAKSNPIVTGSTVRDIYLTDIPLGPTGTTHRYIYRTLGNSSRANVVADTTYYLIKDLSDNTTTVWADVMDDDTADDDAAPTWATASGGTNVTPPIGKYCRIHRERLFIAGNSTHPSYLYWSDEYNPDYFTSTDYEKIREDDGDSITFIAELLGLLVIGKENSIVHYYTNDDLDTNWYASAPFSNMGCIAPYSVSPSPVGIIYLGRKGLYRFIGNRSELISDAVTPEIDDILETAMTNVVGYFWNNEFHLAYTSKASGATANNRELVYDIIRDAYALDYKNTNCFCAASSGSDYGVLYAGDSTTDGYIWAHKVSPEKFVQRYKSEIDAGSFDTTVSSGTEESPQVDIGWDITIDEAVGTIDGHSYGADAIIDRESTSGTWESAIYRVNATSFDKLYWREVLGGTGNIVVDMKTCDDSACSGETYGTDYSDPSGSDISAETANDYVQFRVSFTTTDINYSPYLYTSGGYLLKMVYAKRGTAAESDFLSVWTGGWEDMGMPGRKKTLDRIKVYYTGTTGTLAIQFQNEENDIDTSFNIDMTIDPPYEDENGNKYLGIGEDEKVYAYYPEANLEGLSAIGQFWKFSASETGGDEWSIDRIEVRAKVEESEYD